MASFPAPWYVAGGRALDLFRGHATRPHHNVDIAILRADQLALHRHFAGWDSRKAIPDAHGRLDTWAPGEWLALPIHETHARLPAKTATHFGKAAKMAMPLASPLPVPRRTAAWPPSAVSSRFSAESATELAERELLLNESAGGRWIFRRHPASGCPLAMVQRRSPSGLPYLAAGIVLLYNAPQYKPADDANCDAVAPALGPEPRAWLRDALEVHKPRHPWIAHLETMD